MAMALLYLSNAMAWPKSLPHVPIESSYYEDLDHLAAHGLIKTMLHGQRPYSITEFQRLVREALSRYEEYEKKTDEIQKMLAGLRAEFIPIDGPNRSSEIHLLDHANFTFTALDSPSRSYFNNGAIDAQYNPLAQNQAGRHRVDGTQLAFETNHWGRLGDHFAFYLHPRFQAQTNNGTNENRPFIQEAYATLAFYNTQIDLGRKSIQWGQSRFGGLIFSNNPRPIDGIQVFNPTPWKIGFPIKYHFLLANLGKEQNFEYPYLIGGKITILPFPFLELGIARALIVGGENAPSSSFGDYIAEFFGYRPGNKQITNLSNSISGFEWRGRIPQLRGTEIYGEFYFDDVNFSHPFRSFSQDAGILIGVYLPRLDEPGRLSLRLEGRKFSPILYKHGTWISGWTLNRFILGDPLGPDAESVSLELSRRWSPGLKISTRFSLERIDSDIYQSSSTAGRSVLINGTPEWRVRNQWKVDKKITKRLSLFGIAGFERVKNFGFVQGDDRTNFILDLQLRLDTDDLFTF